MDGIMRKTAIVTGGSRGIGRAIVKQLLAEGYAVAAVGTRPAPDFVPNDDEIGRYRYICADISEKEDRKRILADTMEAFGRLDVLVNNAGVAPAVRTDLLEMDENSYDKVMKINLKGTMFLTQLAAKQMIAQGEKAGIIVNIGSISAEVSSINRGEYCISKAGIGMLTKLYADRLAQEGILVYEVRPGIIETDMTAGVHQKYDALFAGGICPIARWGTPEDVANAISVLCEGRLSYTTGQVVYVDGGFHIQRL